MGTRPSAPAEVETAIAFLSGVVRQTERLSALEVAREGHVVHVRPELVVEVAFNGLQSSPQYPGGVALRFARVVRYRPDKTPEQADTIDAVRALHRG